MKKIITLFLLLACIASMAGCKNNTAEGGVKNEIASNDLGNAVELAKTEFETIFKEFKNLQIEEAVTMARPESKEWIIQFIYSSDNGDGVYGFLYNVEDTANPELIQHGEEITVDNMLK